jgi:hypothetical protein
MSIPNAAEYIRELLDQDADAIGSTLELLKTICMGQAAAVLYR